VTYQVSNVFIVDELGFDQEFKKSFASIIVARIVILKTVQVK